MPNEDNKILEYNYGEKLLKGKYCMKRFCKDLREDAMKIINYENNK